MKKIYLILILFITSCGYQPIYSTKNTEGFKFSKITLIGDNQINQKITKMLDLKEVDTDLSLKELELKSLFTIEETSKDSKGKVISYRSRASVNLEIKKNEKIIKNQNFFEDFVYSNFEKKSDLIEYQKEIENIIINKIVEEIILYMNLE
tara:strand:- start:470 stop:919 length:450 start_codon:yes stop_codon:yes gene_type:complete